MEPLGRDLGADSDKEDCDKDRRAHQIAEIQRHRHRVATGLAERGRENLDEPEAERDFGNL